MYALFSGLLEDVQYTLNNAEGNEVVVQGALLIADGGYLQLGCMMDPSHLLHSTEQTRWSELLESIRKDVECTFGILKIRFRILLHPPELHSFEDIPNVFIRRSISHKMILAYDREHHRECQLWENVDWSVLNPEDLSEDVVDTMLEEAQRNLDIKNALPFLNNPSNDVDVNYFIRPDSELDHVTLKELLVTSYSVQFRLGQVYWPKRFAVGRMMNGNSYACHQGNVSLPFRVTITLQGYCVKRIGWFPTSR